MTSTTRVICWLIAAMLLGFSAGASLAGERPWWATLIAVIAALCALAAGVDATLKLARQRE
ncbi:hypothetical protein ASD37_25205 [Mycobacterium sp. Root135]|uniref:hypothetical protein n=1 Tax=Mycobacterium sp. Root135 TaxID=1736457 RepID=UPI0006FA4218|nr:hypothetical protein [Mycobacterium sp. Root135]KQY04102.1 hypothetical protein ASD37_25205 [Mycobacterium sp. Root135]